MERVIAEQGWEAMPNKVCYIFNACVHYADSLYVC